KTLPGVEAASLGNWLPLAPDNNGTTAQPEGYVPQYKNERIEIGYSVVGHEYFQTMNTRLAQGRSFAVTDDQSSPRVVIINETMARRFWPQQNPIGKRLRLGNNNEAMYEVVGVAEDGKYYFLGEAPKEFMFLPLQQNYSGQMTLLARTSVAPETLAAAVRQEVAQLDSELPVHGVKTMTAYLGRLLAAAQFIAGLVSIFGVLALVMAAVGLYGVMSFAVAGRTREIGIRMALGANARTVFGFILKQGLQMALLGVGLGVVAAFGLTRLI